MKIMYNSINNKSISHDIVSDIMVPISRGVNTRVNTRVAVGAVMDCQLE